MKIEKYIVSLLTLLVVVIFNTNIKAQIIKVKIQATGLTCSMCSNAINNELMAISGVEKVETDLNTNTFTVSLKKENTLTPVVFKKKVEDAGFFVGSMILTMPNSDVVKNPYVLLNKGTSASDFQVVNKGYVTGKSYKKLLKLYSNNKSYANSNDNIFHLKAID